MDAVLTAMVEDKIGPGDRLRFLLQTAKEHLGYDYALALRSPATALQLALKALEVQNGDSVLLSALSPRYYAQVLADMGLQPLYCDVSFNIPCITCESIAKALETKATGNQPRCIVLHHTLGFVPDTTSIAALGIPVIEDISQSYCPLPETQDKQALDSVHSTFYILGLEERDMLTSGGGALLFAMNRKDGAMLRNYASLPPEYCLPDINAALASVQFKEAVRNNVRRQELAEAYTQASLRTKHKRFIPLDGSEYNNYTFPLVLETGMKDVAAYARKKEIIVENAFEHSLAGSGISDSLLCPVSYSLSLRTVLFPLYPRLRSKDAERVSKLIMTLP